MNTDRLLEGQSLVKGDYIMNPSRSAILVLQADGNLVLYRVSDKTVLWATNTNGQNCPRATPVKGNFELYKPDGGIAWTSLWDADWKWGNGTLILQDDGDLVMRSADTNTWNTKTYGLVPKTENDHSGWRPLHIFDVPANGIVDAIHIVPGVDWLGEQLKDFAKTSVGHWTLFVMASAIYPYTSGTWAIGAGTSTPIMVSLGPQIGSVAFALPGVAKGEAFASAWFTEYVNRVMATVAMLSGGALSAVAAAAGALVASQVSQTMMTQIQPAIDKVMNDPAIREMITDGKNLAAIAQSMGIKIPNLRQDVAQAAIDYFKKNVSSFAHDAIKGFDIGGITVADIPAKAGLTFDPATGNLIDTAGLAAIDQQREASALKQGIQFMAGIAFVGLEKKKNPKWTIDMPKLYIWDQQPDGGYLGFTHNLTTGKWEGPGVLLADYLARMKYLSTTQAAITPEALANLNNASGWVPSQAEKDAANAKIAAMQAIELLDPTSWLAKQKKAEATLNQATLNAAMVASKSKLSQYFAKYTALAKSNLK